MSRLLIAITGGIGSGKSVVARMLRAMGYEVYDCDSEARRLVDSDPGLLARIESEVAPGCLSGGSLDRRAVAARVFSDPQALSRLNAIVHPAVRDHLQAWAATRRGSAPCFVETAILRESGLHALVDGEWMVTAPVPVRVSRACTRSGLTPAEAMARIEAQQRSAGPRGPKCSPRATGLLPGPAAQIVNDGNAAVLPRVLHLLGTMP